MYIKRMNEDRETVKEDEDYVDVFAEDFVEAASKLGIKETS